MSSATTWIVSKSVGADKTRESDTLAKAIGAELTDLRRRRGWSQQKLADRIGYDVSHVRQTEMGGNPSLEYLQAVATIFDVSLSEIIVSAERRINKKSAESILDH
jgi:transcriptional regulator with XRE-family HTH domain